jgi:hypothetical protein
VAARATIVLRNMGDSLLGRSLKPDANDARLLLLFQHWGVAKRRRTAVRDSKWLAASASAIQSEAET